MNFYSGALRGYEYRVSKDSTKDVLVIENVYHSVAQSSIMEIFFILRADGMIFKANTIKSILQARLSAINSEMRKLIECAEESLKIDK